VQRVKAVLQDLMQQAVKAMAQQGAAAALEAYQAKVQQLLDTDTGGASGDLAERLQSLAAAGRETVKRFQGLAAGVGDVDGKVEQELEVAGKELQSLGEEALEAVQENAVGLLDKLVGRVLDIADKPNSTTVELQVSMHTSGVNLCRLQVTAQYRGEVVFLLTWPSGS
jgi:hypothetical protein